MKDAAKIAEASRVLDSQHIRGSERMIYMTNEQARAAGFDPLTRRLAQFRPVKVNGGALFIYPDLGV
jgi:hypothetical protein